MDEAIGLIENILEHNPNNAEALGFLSLLYFDLNEEELAKQTSTSTLVLNPENYDAKLVNSLIRLMAQETTIEEIEELIQINPQDCAMVCFRQYLYDTGNLNLLKYTQKA